MVGSVVGRWWAGGGGGGGQVTCSNVDWCEPLMGSVNILFVIHYGSML